MQDIDCERGNSQNQLMSHRFVDLMSLDQKESSLVQSVDYERERKPDLARVEEDKSRPGRPNVGEW